MRCGLDRGSSAPPIHFPCTSHPHLVHVPRQRASSAAHLLDVHPGGVDLVIEREAPGGGDAALGQGHCTPGAAQEDLLPVLAV